MGRKRRWSDTQLRNSVARLGSMRSVLIELGLRPLGSNYGTVRRRIAELGLSTSHWLGQAWLRGRTHRFLPHRALSDVLQPGSTYQSAKLKARLLEAGLLSPICKSCGNVEWLGAPIPLELDHIDGDSANNSLENLRLLCPNCHAQTPTYRARNAKYPHIPALDDIERGVDSAGSIGNYADRLGVSAECVRGWLRSARLRRMSKVGENVAAYDQCARVVELVDTGDLSHLSAAGETRWM